MSGASAKTMRSAAGAACIAAVVAAFGCFAFQFVPGEPRAPQPEEFDGSIDGVGNNRYRAERIVDVPFGQTYRAESLTRGKWFSMSEDERAALSDEERERVFFLFKYSENSILTSGTHFFGNWWAEAVGAVNVAQELDVDNQAEVNLEQVYAWDPDMILITNFTSAQPQDLYDNTVGSYDWSGVSAVKNQQVYKMPLGMYRSYTPGVDTPVTLLWLAQTVYPNLFADIDIVEKTKDYYKTVFGVELTEEQAASIFAPVSDAAAGF